MEDSASELPDWSYLPLAVVHLISEKIKSMADYVRFRAVCSPWRSASLPKPHHFPPQLPWLMMPYKPDRKDDDGIRLFYDLWESKMRKLHLPETIGAKHLASNSGWLLLMRARGSEVFFLNPLTRTRINLPPFTVAVKNIRMDENSQVNAGLSSVNAAFYWNLINAIIKVTFSSDLTDPNCLIMMFNRGELLSCRVGDSCWTIYLFYAESKLRRLDDAACHNGFFYLLEGETLEIYDICLNKVQILHLLNPEFQYVRKYFLVRKSRLHLIVVRSPQKEEREGDEALEWDHKQIVDMYQISDDFTEVQWITDTSDTTIFYERYFRYLAVSTDDWNSDGGCMYMSVGRNKYRSRECYSILFSKLNDYSFQPVLTESSLNRTPRPAIWFQPSLF